MFNRKTRRGAILTSLAASLLAGSTAAAWAAPPPVPYPHPPIHPRSIGGHTITDPTPTPVVALYKNQQGFMCGGVLIAPDAVLTAAHCTTEPPAPEADPQAPPSPAQGLTIRAGSIDRTEGTVHHVTQIAAAPEWAWGTGAPGDRVGDLSVLHLDTPVQGITPARIAHLNPARPVEVVGWGFQVQPVGHLVNGLTAAAVPSVIPGGIPFPIPVPDLVPPPTVLNTVSVRAVDPSRCHSSDPADPGIGPSESCLASEQLASNPCNGDIGTPGLQHGAVVALISRGTEAPCVLGNTITTKPADYTDWIEATITAHRQAAQSHG